MRISDWSSDVCSSDLLGGWRSLIGERQARPENARLTKLLRGNSESIIQCSCRGSVDLVEEIACENAGGNALVAERVAPMDARVDDSKSLLRYGIGDVWIGRSINPDVPACFRQIPGPRLLAVLCRERACAVIARKRDIVVGAKVDLVFCPIPPR